MDHKNKIKNLFTRFQKLRRLIYIATYDQFLCKFIRKDDAHKAGHGKTIEASESVHSLFIKNVSPHVICIRIANHKDYSRSIRLKERRCDEVRKSEGMSGNIETVTDFDVLLDDFILEIQEFEESHRVERKEQIARKQQLTAAGATIRQIAVSH